MVPCRSLAAPAGRVPAARASFLAALAILAAVTAALADRSHPRTDLEIRPGPKRITDEERAIAPDPERGIEHAVILVEETERNDSGRILSEVTYHRRAKILSNQGRDLANIVIPFNRQEGVLAEWWGRTILPDGTVLEVRTRDLVEQTIARYPGGSNRILKAVLAGVQPGCVIDYGYVFRWKRVPWWARVPIQRRWPVREFRLRWVPARGFGSAYDLKRAEGLDVSLVKDTRSLLVSGNDLPAIIPEPFMPPEAEAGAAFYFSYTDTAVDAESFWKRAARLLEGEAVAFADPPAIRDLVARMSLPAGASPLQKARVAYDWIASNIRNSGAGEESEYVARRLAEEKSPPRAADVLKAREARGLQLDYLFLAIAREVGASGHLVLASDRRDHYWDEALLTMDQFDWALVAVHTPNRPEEDETLTDPGSGLPFGEVPWWLTGVRGLLAAGPDTKPIMIPPTEARRNVLESRASIAFGKEETSAAAAWSRRGTGQQGYLDLWTLRGLSLDDRKSRLVALCGGSAGVEVTRAESRTIDEPGTGFDVECEGKIVGAGPAADQREHNLRFSGPWMEPVPELASPSRVQPIVFPYPRLDITSIDVAAPEGFVPVEPPLPVTLDSPFGRYLLSIIATDTGYHIERVFSLTTLGAPAHDYETLRGFLAVVRRSDYTLLEFRRSGEAP